MIAARRVEWCDTWKDTRRLKVERDTLYRIADTFRCNVWSVWSEGRRLWRDSRSVIRHFALRANILAVSLSISPVTGD